MPDEFQFLRVPKGRKAGVAHRRSRVQERATAKRVGGFTTPGSGNQGEKGDVRKPGRLRIECKTTTKASFSVTLEMVRKIEEASLPRGELPFIEVEFIDQLGKPIASVVVTPAYVLDHVTD